jgi:hypothetical protein
MGPRLREDDVGTEFSLPIFARRAKLQLFATTARRGFFITAVDIFPQGNKFSIKAIASPEIAV